VLELGLHAHSTHRLNLSKHPDRQLLLRTVPILLRRIWLLLVGFPLLPCPTRLALPLAQFPWPAHLWQVRLFHLLLPCLLWRVQCPMLLWSLCPLRQALPPMWACLLPLCPRILVLCPMGFARLRPHLLLLLSSVQPPPPAPLRWALLRW
jgi:hypothetical protein